MSPLLAEDHPGAGPRGTANDHRVFTLLSRAPQTPHNSHVSSHRANSLGQSRTGGIVRWRGPHGVAPGAARSVRRPSAAPGPPHPPCTAIRTPGRTPHEVSAPASASSTCLARKRGSPTLPGRIVRTDRTRKSRSRWATSIAKRIPTVCTELAGVSSSAPSVPVRPSSPRRRARADAAISRGTGWGRSGVVNVAMAAKVAALHSKASRTRSAPRSLLWSIGGCRRRSRAEGSKRSVSSGKGVPDRPNGLCCPSYGAAKRRVQAMITSRAGPDRPLKGPLRAHLGVVRQLRRVVVACRCAQHHLRRVMVETPPRAGPSPPHGPARFLCPCAPRPAPLPARHPGPVTHRIPRLSRIASRACPGAPSRTRPPPHRTAQHRKEPRARSCPPSVLQPSRRTHGARENRTGRTPATAAHPPHAASARAGQRIPSTP